MNGWGGNTIPFSSLPNGNNEYTLTTHLEAGNSFKVRDGNGNGDNWYPGGANYDITVTGDYDIYFRPDYSGGQGWHEGCIYVEPHNAE